ncbi:MAG: SPOR domain-containing protein [Burkholderiaceae bacterium]|nr:SPOR domain-containing protein [Burkholderiaceae bacterium]
MKQQRGGTILGFILGVVVGLGAALAVAVYVTKVPIPFVNKGQVRSADQDVIESERNKNWDPNAPLYGKTPAKPATPANADAAAGVDAAAPAVPVAKGAEQKPAVSADPLGDLAQARTAGPATEPFSYFVQIGAFRTAEDAESQRARLSLGGVQAKVSEREQSGRAVFRVRVGPLNKKEEADSLKEKLDAAGYETALVRVQR